LNKRQIFISNKKSFLKLWLAIFVFFLVLSMISIPVKAQDPTSTTSTLTPTAEVLNLTFPPAVEHPISDWRSPLYPIPFALGLHDHFYLNRPIGVDSVNWPLPEYRYGYIESETDNPHTGVDIDAALHTPILAAADGKVVFTGYGLALGKGNKADPYGLAVVIRHDFSFEGQSILTVYAHMEKVLVEVGQYVTVGEPIGKIGITGNTSGPHVHFEVRLEKNGQYTVQNPELWMVPTIGNGTLVGQFKDNYGYFLTSRTVLVKSKSNTANWTVYTYASQTLNNDSYYQENLALGDIPAGDYEVTFLNNFNFYKYSITISPGAITYITFTSNKGFETGISKNITPETFAKSIR
jgi:hypothetical protein